MSCSRPRTSPCEKADKNERYPAITAGYRFFIPARRRKNMRGFFGRGVYNGIETQPDRAVRPGARELDRVADGDHPKHGAKLSPQRAAPPRHAGHPGGHTGAGRLPRGSDFAGGAQRRRPCRTGPPLARGPGAALPKVLLLTVHRADRGRAGHDRPGRRGQALSPEKAAAQDVGR